MAALGDLRQGGVLLPLQLHRSDGNKSTNYTVFKHLTY